MTTLDTVSKQVINIQQQQKGKRALSQSLKLNCKINIFILYKLMKYVPAKMTSY